MTNFKTALSNNLTLASGQEGGTFSSNPAPLSYTAALQRCNHPKVEPLLRFKPCSATQENTTKMFKRENTS